MPFGNVFTFMSKIWETVEATKLSHLTGTSMVGARPQNWPVHSPSPGKPNSLSSPRMLLIRISSEGNRAVTPTADPGPVKKKEKPARAKRGRPRMRRSELHRRKVAGHKLLGGDATTAAKHRFISRSYVVLALFFATPLLILVAFKVIFEYLSLGSLDPRYRKPYASVISLSVSVFLVCVISCGFESWRRYPPTNVTLVLLFGTSAALTAGFFGAFLPLLHVCTIFLLTAVCVQVAAAAACAGLQQNVDLSSRAGTCLLCCLLALLMAATAATFVLAHPHMREARVLLWMLVPAGLAVTYVVVMLVDTHLFLSGSWPIHANEYTFAAVTLFINMVAFVFLVLRICPWKLPASSVAKRVTETRVSVNTIQIKPKDALQHIHDKKCRHNHDNASTTPPGSFVDATRDREDRNTLH